jgi:hypothetical protein
MPFKGDLRLGGPHDNEANLNGTSSDFDGVPEVGTILSGPTDTSRYEQDYVGNSFYMPYSTTVYADGNGGQNPVETWGLQYLPAGWVTSHYNVPSTLSYNFYLSNGTVASGNVTAGTFHSYGIEDGTGINYVSEYVSYNYVDGQAVDQQLDGYVGGDPVYRWSVYFNLSGPSIELAYDNTPYPPVGTYIDSGSYNLEMTFSSCNLSHAYGYVTYDNYSDGQGSSYGANEYSYETTSAGTYLGECNGEFFFYNGSGTAQTGCAPYGYSYSDDSSSNLDWYYPQDGSYGGQFTYSSSGCSYVADGNCNFNTQNCWSWNATSGDQIANGQYSTFVGDGTYDEWGNENGYTYYTNWTHYYDGNGGYTTYTYTS